MPAPWVIYEKAEPHTAIVRMNNSEKKNAMSRVLTQALGETWREIREDDDIWTVILTGTADSFSAGGDLRENLARAKGEIPAERSDAIVGEGGYADLRVVGNKPIIAAVNGYAVGGGFGLALSCDIRYCSPNAKFGPSEVRWSHMAAWPKYFDTIPLGWGFWFALTGQMVDADTAFRLGIVQKVSEPDKLIDDCLELCEIINRNGRLIAAHTKEYMYRCMREIAGWDAMDALHSLYYYHLRQTKDYDEGSAAFVEKRTPAFTGEFYKMGDKPPGVA